MSDRTEVWLHHSDDPHTAIPDWLVRAKWLSRDARLLAWLILTLQRSPLPPTLVELADHMDVDIRSISRWLDELRAASVLTSKRIARRNIYIIHRPILDSAIIDPTIIDPTIIDRTIIDPTIIDPRVHVHYSNQINSLTHTNEPNSPNSENPIMDRRGGGGGDHHDLVKDSPTSTKRAKAAQPCYTALGRFLAASGFGSAKEFDDSALDSEHWIAYVKYQLDAGMDRGRIVHFLRMHAPLEWIAPSIATSQEPTSQEDPPAEAWRLGLSAPTIEETEARRILRENRKK